MKRTKAVGVALALAVIGCQSIGRQIRPEAVRALKKGDTTYEQAVRELGTPQTMGKRSDGSRTVVWTYIYSEAKAISYVPIIGWLIPQSDIESDNLMVDFDAAGKVSEVFMARSTSEAKGLFAADGPSAPLVSEGTASASDAPPPTHNVKMGGYCRAEFACVEGLVCSRGVCQR